nr:hypothetical protein [Morchella crassipes]
MRGGVAASLFSTRQRSPPLPTPHHCQELAVGGGGGGGKVGGGIAPPRAARGGGLHAPRAGRLLRRGGAILWFFSLSLREKKVRKGRCWLVGGGRGGVRKWTERRGSLGRLRGECFLLGSTLLLLVKCGHFEVRKINIL